MDPIVPMEPISSREIPVGDDWIAQVKWDGVRILTYANRGSVRLFNRKRRERTQHYPELHSFDSYCSATSAILDGEMIALGTHGTPDFHEVMRRDALRRLEKVPLAQKAVPVVYMIFDILYYDGAWMTQRPLEERLALLSRVITPSSSIQVVDSHSDGEAVFRAVRAKGMEGVVAKRLSSPYLIGGKKDIWQKIKNYRDLIAVIGGYTLNDAGVVNAILLGMYNAQGELWYIGHSGTGKLSHQDWRELTALLTPTTIPDRPFANKPERHTDAFWVQPAHTVKVQFMEWTAGGTLRQPSIQAVVNISPEDCRLEDEWGSQ